jgi:hypothetical protein
MTPPAPALPRIALTVTLVELRGQMKKKALKVSSEHRRIA